jgi:predicted PP-loop superfamily ATPase
MKNIHRTASGRKSKELRAEARTWREKAQNIRDAAPELEPAARLREEEARRLEGEALVALERAKLEAVTVYLGGVKKTTAKGTKTYRYYFASWRVGDKVVNKYIGSPRKMTIVEATAKARELKRRDLHLTV